MDNPAVITAERAEPKHRRGVLDALRYLRRTFLPIRNQEPPPARAAEPVAVPASALEFPPYSERYLALEKDYSAREERQKALINAAAPFASDPRVAYFLGELTRQLAFAQVELFRLDGHERAYADQISRPWFESQTGQISNSFRFRLKLFDDDARDLQSRVGLLSLLQRDGLEPVKMADPLVGLREHEIVRLQTEISRATEIYQYCIDLSEDIETQRRRIDAANPGVRLPLTSHQQALLKSWRATQTALNRLSGLKGSVERALELVLYHNHPPRSLADALETFDRVRLNYTNAANEFLYLASKSE